MRAIRLVWLSALLAAPLCVAQGVPSSAAPDEKSISLPEFRQSLQDLLSVMNPRAAADYAKVLPFVPDSLLAQWYQSVPDGKRFQAAATHLKLRKEAALYTPSQQDGRTASMVNSSRLADRRSSPSQGFHLDPFAGSPATGIGNPPLPNIGLFTPNYPSGSNWSNMAGTLQNSGYLSGDLSSANCSANDKSSLTITVSTFHGIKDAADGICEIIPDILVVVLGEGTEIPAKEICYIASLIIGAFDAAFEGYLQDCETQNQLTSAAESQAAYNNTLALYNLKFRLKVEQNLLNPAAPLGIFETPSRYGGYLESVRAIVAATIANMQSLSLNESSALASLAQGDNFYSSGAFKSAYSAYRKAYSLAAQ